jgi:two-component system, chemotaxis family, protein-glutamate methylesterase/glutaminase
MEGKKIRVLVVDDSAIIRRAISQVVQETPDIEIAAVAADGKEAIKKYIEFRPDVVTMDVIMPNMDGLSALRQLVEKYRAPVIMLSGLTKEGANITMRSINLGAVDFVTKPQKGSMLLNFQFLKEELIGKIRAAANINMEYYLSIKGADEAALEKEPADDAPRKPLSGYTRPELIKLADSKVVVIGASTGGPKAVEFILGKIRKNFPVGIVVVQHMPRFFTRFFAERLNRVCHLPVVEAQDGEIVEAGKVLVAPGDYDITIKKSFLAPQIALQQVNTDHTKPTPSIDALFYSAAATFGGKTIGVILTGMGRDGSRGFKAIKIMGGKTIAQDEKTSLVFGMPKSAIADGVVDTVLSLQQIPAMIDLMVTNEN